MGVMDNIISYFIKPFFTIKYGIRSASARFYASEALNTFIVDPGSKASVTALLRQNSLGNLPKELGLKRG